jgi:hypothetical protein
MPVDVTSRYWPLQAYQAPGTDGPVSTLPLRPNDEVTQADLVNHRVSGLETVEYLSWRYYGRSAAWWRIADSNPIAFPLDYRPGATVRVAPAGSINRVLRTRTF